VTAVYLERTLPLQLGDGERVRALAYVVDRRHPQYAGRLPHGDLLRLVRQGHGVSGRNRDYVRSTHEHLLAMGVVDPILAHLCTLLQED
jgi:cation transport protein ChaC